MNDIAGDQLLQWISKGTRNQEIDALYVYSPLCGTCNLAERMLQITLESLPAYRIGKLNLNDSPEVAQAFKIHSIPCLIIWNPKQPREEPKLIYAMHSVTHLYEQLKGGFAND